MPGKGSSIKAWSSLGSPDPCPGTTLLEDIAIMHWDGRGVGSPTVQHEACGASICKAGRGWVKETTAAREGSGTG